jgi:hypothetical protein
VRRLLPISVLILCVVLSGCHLMFDASNWLYNEILPENTTLRITSSDGVVNIETNEPFRTFVVEGRNYTVTFETPNYMSDPVALAQVGDDWYWGSTLLGADLDGIAEGYVSGNFWGSNSGLFIHDLTSLSSAPATAVVNVPMYVISTSAAPLEFLPMTFNKK